MPLLASGKVVRSTKGGRDRRSRRVQRVDGPAARRLWPADAGSLYRRVAEKRFLRWMGPWGPRVRKFDGPLAPRVVDCPWTHLRCEGS